MSLVADFAVPFLKEALLVVVVLSAACVTKEPSDESQPVRHHIVFDASTAVYPRDVLSEPAAQLGGLLLKEPVDTGSFFEQWQDQINIAGPDDHLDDPFESAFAAVAAILTGPSAGEAHVVCTGTLIGAHTILTARHCITDAPDRYYVFFLQGGIFRVRRTFPNLDDPSASNDLVVLDVWPDVKGIRPPDLYANSWQQGTPGVIVGFGHTGGDQRSGFKRVGRVHLRACPPDRAIPLGSICWQFDGSENDTCKGDSGGPLFIGGRLAAVTRGGTTDCLPVDDSYDVDLQLAANARFLHDALDVIRDARPVAPSVLMTKGSARKLPIRFGVGVTTTMSFLHVGLSSFDDQETKVWLEVRPAGGDGQSIICDGRATFWAACEWRAPRAGSWEFTIKGHLAQPDDEIQVVVSSL